ncbi:thioredoxin domain-containing protein [Pullulanibacillus sp. KACC 23026]|uniref:DsbA family protein n=1 Tax=Pullulanibacillus sp. KACC 23026 TaxID=3028315 RepID=UPI0023B025D4|nr:thioredoxin domain-containing protein [Pullulanibacillus sp. KACC 23026]WEG12135.1 thioredoxin domain-containing protein [Pullulanibacillus sp. KACC 23026]
MALKKKVKKKSGFSIWIFYGTIGIIAICTVVLIIIGHSQSSKVAGAVTFNYNDEPYLGKKGAPVKIVEFGDYKCPICKNFNDATFPAIDQDLIQTGKATFYFMNDPFINKDSTRAALFAETVYNELGNKLFWKFHDLLYSKQPADSKYEQIDLYSESFLEKTLSEITSPTNVNKVVQAFKTNKFKSALDKDTAYVNQLSIQGTPTFFVNGKEFTGNSYQELVDQVDQLAK